MEAIMTNVTENAIVQVGIGLGIAYFSFKSRTKSHKPYDPPSFLSDAEKIKWYEKELEKLKLNETVHDLTKRLEAIEKGHTDDRDAS